MRLEIPRGSVRGKVDQENLGVKRVGKLSLLLFLWRACNESSGNC